MARKSISVHKDYYAEIKNLSREERGDVLLALVNWADDDNAPPMNAECAMLVRLMCASIERISKTNSGNGSLGGAPVNNRNAIKTSETTETSEAPENNQNKPTDTVSVTDTDTVSDTATTPQTPQGAEAEADETRSDSVPYAKIQAMYNTICVSLPKIQRIDGERRKAVAARFKSYGSLEPFEKLFRSAEASAFLRGGGEKNFRADFDWLIKANNMSKVLEGKYEDRAPPDNPPTPHKSVRPVGKPGEAEMAAIQRMLSRERKAEHG